MTFIDPNDPNRSLDPPSNRYQPEEERSTGMVWGTVAVLGLLIGGGLIFYNWNGKAPEQTAANKTVVTRSTPTQVPAPTPAPGPNTPTTDLQK